MVRYILQVQLPTGGHRLYATHADSLLEHGLCQVFPKSQLENMEEERAMITVGLCGRSPEVKDPFVQQEQEAPAEEEEPQEEPFVFKIWSEQPPDVEDGPSNGS